MYFIACIIASFIRNIFQVVKTWNFPITRLTLQQTGYFSFKAITFIFVIYILILKCSVLCRLKRVMYIETKMLESLIQQGGGRWHATSSCVAVCMCTTSSESSTGKAGEVAVQHQSSWLWIHSKDTNHFEWCWSWGCQETVWQTGEWPRCCEIIW